jgi:hypothetical protein
MYNIIILLIILYILSLTYGKDEPNEPPKPPIKTCLYLSKHGRKRITE